MIIPFYINQFYLREDTQMYKVYGKSITTDEIIEMIQNSNHEEADQFIAFVNLQNLRILWLKHFNCSLMNL